MNTKVFNKEIIAVYSEKDVSLDVGFSDSTLCYYSEKLIADFKVNPETTLLYFGFEDKTTSMSVSLAFLHSICQRFIRHISQDADIEYTRVPAAPLDEELSALLQDVPFANGTEYIDKSWLKNLWDKLSEAFAAEISAYGGTVAEFLKMHNANIHLVGRVFFHLVENKSPEYPFAFLATYATEAEDSPEHKARHVPLKNALLEYEGQQDLLLKLLATVSQAADTSDFISELVESGELFSPLKFTAEEAYTFLQEIPLYEACGILCRMPNWWKKRSSSVKLSLSMGETAPSQVGMEALIRFNPEFYFGDEKMTKEEIEALLAQTSGLSFLKGKWIEVDHQKLQAALEAYEKAASLDDMTLAEAMRMQLGLNNELALADEKILEIKNGTWLRGVQDRLLNPAEIEKLDAGESFKATLRQYQQTGLDWLATMKSLGFGALLADDMGLGKTVQILALLEYLRTRYDLKALLIIPASLIGNWKNELDKFTPELTYQVLHAQNITFDPQEACLFITTYGMAVRLDALKEYTWDIVILDEAQAIKNPLTKQTKAVKKIPSAFRIAMTGTPIENKLSDLWSLFDFLNTGLLGSSKEFSAFAKQMPNSDSYAKLRNMISPFILRRLKTDKSIIRDLPEKVEMKAYASLTKKQIVLYKGLVQELEYKLVKLDGIERKGIVLAAIMKFKQICNHPDQYLGQTTYEFEHSGKFQKLAEICETIQEKRERLLVFTQFKEMTKPIAQYLETIFHRPGLVLHGGTQVKKRTELVNLFNGEEYIPFMVLSLKAGGVGLNLTSANHVVHFDRWWNPAVENQATDRAFRIGQKKNVVVHKFITAGTIEEKIDAMIEEKQKLAGDLITSSGENWITEMSNDELMELFTLA